MNLPYLKRVQAKRQEKTIAATTQRLSLPDLIPKVSMCQVQETFCKTAPKYSMSPIRKAVTKTTCKIGSQSEFKHKIVPVVSKLSLQFSHNNSIDNALYGINEDIVENEERMSRCSSPQVFSCRSEESSLEERDDAKKQQIQQEAVKQYEVKKFEEIQLQYEKEQEANQLHYQKMKQIEYQIEMLDNQRRLLGISVEIPKSLKEISNYTIQKEKNLKQLFINYLSAPLKLMSSTKELNKQYKLISYDQCLLQMQNQSSKMAGSQINLDQQIEQFCNEIVNNLHSILEILQQQSEFQNQYNEQFSIVWEVEQLVYKVAQMIETQDQLKLLRDSCQEIRYKVQLIILQSEIILTGDDIIQNDIQTSQKIVQHLNNEIETDISKDVLEVIESSIREEVYLQENLRKINTIQDYHRQLSKLQKTRSQCQSLLKDNLIQQYNKNGLRISDQQALNLLFKERTQKMRYDETIQQLKHKFQSLSYYQQTNIEFCESNQQQFSKQVKERIDTILIKQQLKQNSQIQYSEFIKQFEVKNANNDFISNLENECETLLLYLRELYNIKQVSNIDIEAPRQFESFLFNILIRISKQESLITIQKIANQYRRQIFLCQINPLDNNIDANQIIQNEIAKSKAILQQLYKSCDTTSSDHLQLIEDGINSETKFLLDLEQQNKPNLEQIQLKISQVEKFRKIYSQFYLK